MTNTATPGFNRLISPGALARIGTSGPMLYSDSPPVKVTCSTAPCAALVTVPTVALVITLSGSETQAECPPAIGVALGEDASLDCVNLAVLILDPGRGDKVARLDVGEAFLDKGDNVDIRRERNRQRLAVAGFDRQIVAVELLDGAADAGRCAVRRRGLSERRHRNQSGHGDSEERE